MTSRFRTPIAALLCLCAATAFAQSRLVQKVALQDVTVFLRGAQLFGTVSVDVPAGESEWVLSNVAGHLNEQSLSVAAEGGVVVQSSTVRNDFLNEEALSPQASEIKRQLEAVRTSRAQLETQQSVIDEQLAMLKENRRLGGKEGAVSVQEIDRMLDLLNRKMSAALLSRARLAEQLVKVKEQEDKLAQQLDEEKAKGFQPGGRIAVKLYAPKATRSVLNLTYVVPQAGWVPSYDLQVAKVGAPVQMSYKARVFQNSGIPWEKVRLTLSTGNPAQSAQAPVLRPWALVIDNPPEYLADAMMAPAPMAAPVPRAEAAAPKRAKDAARQQALDGYVTTNANGINTQFEIALPYTVPSDGKGHLVMVKSAQLPASYRYVVTPKLDADAFLQAQIQNWGDLNLLPGESNIFYEGGYVGQGRIDAATTKDALAISLGRDKRIIVSRDNDLAFKKQPEFFGSNIRQQFGYKIQTRNTRKDAVDLVVMDQVPLSRDSEVRVEDLQYGAAQYQPVTGELQWTLKLGPNEARTLPFSYTVTYPKDKRVLGL